MSPPVSPPTHSGRAGSCLPGTPAERRRRSRCGRSRRRRSPSVRTAAAESPPPTTVRPSTAVSAWATAFVPAANGAISKTPIGPFQKTVRASASLLAKSSAVRGPMSRPIRSAGIASAATTVASASAAKRVAATTSTGSTSSTPRSRSRADQLAHRVQLVGLQQRRPHPVPLGRQEGVRHAAADQEPVDLGEQVGDDGELVGDLRPAEHHDVGPAGSCGEPPQHVDLGQHQTAGGVRQAHRHVVDAGVLAVHRAEPVPDVQLGQASEGVGEGATFGVVLAGLPRLEAEVLQQRDLPVRESAHHRCADVADHVGGERHRRAEQLAQPVGDRPQRQLRPHLALRPAEVRAHDDPRAPGGQRAGSSAGSPGSGRRR